MNSITGALVASLTIAAIGGWVGARAVILLASRVGLEDVPNARSSHTTPTPRGGGIGIVVGAMLGTLSFHLLTAGCDPAGAPIACAPRGDAAIWLGIGATGALAMVGLADDFLNLSRRGRLITQALAALGVLLAVDAYGTLPLALFSLLLLASIWWINLFNFMDGIDGIAATQALFMLGCGLLVGLLDAGRSVPGTVHGLDFIDLYGLWLLAATLGFIGLNWAPAKVFMGDVGSLFLGVSILLTATHDVTSGHTSVWFWLIAGGMFVSDATVTLLNRLARGEDVTTAHRSHVYQRLARRWDSHAKVTLVYFAISLSWFLPWALLAHLFPAWGPGIAMLACLPVMAACHRLGAGEPDRPNGTHNNINR